MRALAVLFRVLAGVAVVVVLACVAFYFWARQPAIDPVPAPQTAGFDRATVARGAELAAVGNCAACHTEKGGPALAGGYKVPTPFGAVYGTNITPDPETGIGHWSEAAFVRAMREGIRRDGAHLYPAFPYPHFTRISDQDANALYAYLMTRPPVKHSTPPPELPFPLNIRLVMAGWNLLYLDDHRFRPDPSKNDQWNRGAYIAEGLGHCGACHTPKNWLGAEEKGAAYDGGDNEGWHAPALNDHSPSPVPWGDAALTDYLGGSFAPHHGVAAGPMQQVTETLAHAPHEDVAALAAYIGSLPARNGSAGGGQPAPPDLAAADKAAFKVATAQSMNLSGPADTGEAVFASACAACHFEGGSQPYYRPVRLGLSDAVNATDPRNFIHIVLAGIQPPAGERGRWMPPFDQLSDHQIAMLTEYVRSHFTGKAAWRDVPKTVADIREGSGS